MIKSDRNSWKSRFTDNVQNLWRVDCIMYGETTRGDCRYRSEYLQTIGRGRFWGPAPTLNEKS